MSSSVLFQPKIIDVHTVNPETIAIRISAQETVRGHQIPYEAEASDRVLEDGWIIRNGEVLGVTVGPDKSILRLPDQIHGLPLDTAWADDLSNYRISPAQDSDNSESMSPVAVYRKSKPISSQLAYLSPTETVSPLTHTVYLKLPEPLQVGETYDIDFLGDHLSDISYRYEPTVDRSEAVHVSQIGFDPGDGAKVAFLSQWMGTGGALDYTEGTKFWLIDEETGAKVYEGQIELSRGKDEFEDSRETNYNLTDVYIMDFSEFQSEGTFRVAVDGIGTSFSFEIGETTWEDAFYVTARGFFHQRSGVALEQPYTDYERPRSFHPEDGVKIYQSTVPLMDTHMGLNLQEVRAFDALTATRTDEVVTDAWGGWFDAGDWDRRIQHLEATRNLLELAEISPTYFQSVNLNIIESDNHIADIIDEALWGLDIFRRLQTSEGGIPGGIESSGHPNLFEASWQESQTVMVYGPGIWSSYIYAATAAQAALVLAPIDPNRSQVYQESALRSMAWAEQEYAIYEGPNHSSIDDWRNLAALDLYRLTSDASWHELFLDTTIFTDPEADLFLHKVHNREESAYIYAQLDSPEVDRTVQENAYQALLRAGNAEIENIEKTGFKWQKRPNVRARWGSSIGHPDVTTLLRSHQISEDTKYLDAAILGVQFTSGANPDNLVYTTGLGQRSPQDPLIADVRATGSSVIPSGITLYGPYDYGRFISLGGWQFFEDDTFPIIREWPVTENYFDIYQLAAVTEFTAHQTMAPTSYAFGYLAAVDHIESVPEADNPVPGVEIVGTQGADQLVGSAGNDTIDGGSRSDVINGLEGNDLLIGGWGWDTLDGGAGNDRLVGGAGRDTYTGGEGRDTFVLSADGQRDTITDLVVNEDWIDISQLGPPNTLDTNNDGLVDDTFLMTVDSNDLMLNLSSLEGDSLILKGQADLLNSLSLDVFSVPTEDTDDNGAAGDTDGSVDSGDSEDSGDSGDNTVSPDDEPVPGVEIVGTKAADQLEGTAGNDSIDGGSNRDTIYGLDGDDVLIGGWGWDTLDGGAGNDRLLGGPGKDTYTGGTGADIFVLYTSSHTTLVTDFETGVDRLDMSALGISFGALDADDDGFVDKAFVTTQDQGIVLNLSAFGGGTVVLQGMTSLEGKDIF